MRTPLLCPYSSMDIISPRRRTIRLPDNGTINLFVDEMDVKVLFA